MAAPTHQLMRHGGASRRTTAALHDADRHDSPRALFVEGGRAMLPWLVGIVPFGLIIGMTSTGNGLPVLFGLATGVGIYSGSAQLTAIELVSDGAAVGAIVASVLVLNARLIMYSSSMAQHWRGTPRRFRVAAAYLLVDPSFAEGDRRYRSGTGGGHWFYLGTAITLWVAWQVAILLGALGGAVVPSSARLEYVIPLFLFAELVGVARSRPAIVGALTASLVALLATGVPMHGGLLIAIAGGVTAGALADRGRS